MRANLRRARVKFLSGATIGLAVIFVGGSRAAFAQSTNTFPTSGSAGVGTTSPSSLNSRSPVVDIKGDPNSLPGLVFHSGNTSYPDNWEILLSAPAAGESAFNIFTGTSNVFHIRKTGSVGVGTMSPSGTKLHVLYDVGNDATILAEAGSSMSPALEFKDAAATPNRWRIGSGFNTTTDGLFFIYDKRQSAARMIIDTSGNVGIGTSSPSTLLHVSGAQTSYGDMGADNVAVFKGTTAAANNALWIDSPSNKIAQLRLGNNGLAKWGLFNDGGGAVIPANAFGIYDYASAAARLVILNSGNVGIGKNNPTVALDVQGDIKASGSIAAKYQDVAEWVPSSERIVTGTVVVLDTTKSNQVTTSSEAYDTRVAGVVSEQPGIALGESGTGKVLVATTGRVLVKVDASKAPIHIGDLLVTSEIPGFAMKSEPITIGNRKFHTPGTLIGKALESMEKGSGKILVLLSLQ